MKSWEKRTILLIVMFLALGCASNLAVISANGFRMPVHSAYIHEEDARHQTMTEETNLNFMGDIFNGNPIGRGILSIGDIYIYLSAGMFAVYLFILAGLGAKYSMRT